MRKKDMEKIRLSEHFSLAEMTRTSVKGVSNTPSAQVIGNLRHLCNEWLEELRDEWNARYGDGDDPILINSGYRSQAVNRAVGGVTTSNHLTGCAADIRVSGIEQLLRYATILLDLSDENGTDFDELLLERKGNSMWLHFAVRPTGNRRKVKLLN